MGVTYVETYLGCKIYHYTPPDVAYEQYGSPCLTSNYTKLGAVKKRICTGQGGTWTWNEAKTDGTCSFEVGIPTTLTLSAPDKVGPGETFNIIGQLTRDDTGAAIPNMSINVSYNGNSLGSVLTDMQGVYTISATIPTTGTHTLKTEFPGAAGYAASSKTTRMGVGVPLTQIPYVAFLSILTGLAIAHLPRR